MSMTHGDLIRRYECKTGARVDSAFPQMWFDHENERLAPSGLSVWEVYAGWVYDTEAKIFGRPLLWHEVAVVLAAADENDQ